MTDPIYLQVLKKEDRKSRLHSMLRIITCAIGDIENSETSIPRTTVAIQTRKTVS